ncbi:4-hydroxy-tetrahydrodipicolinate reductase [Bacteroidota bacterium]
MKIAIIGYGKMGRMIESIAREKGHSIGSCIDIDNQDLLLAENLRQHDVAIELTTPETAFANISKCLDAGLPVVSGTTGWTDRLDELTERCKKENGTFLYASNFSLGVNLLFYMNRHLASVMNRHKQYDIRMSETHHTQKLDAPSGTALTLAEDILQEIDHKKYWALLEPRSGANQGTSEDPEKLWIEAIREGTVAGIHEVSYESEFDSLSLKHSAKDRRGFALGAVLAAEYIHNKKGFFTMKEVLDLR